jgi:ABC-type sugar transport system substrate-binding protein
VRTPFAAFKTGVARAFTRVLASFGTGAWGNSMALVLRRVRAALLAALVSVSFHALAANPWDADPAVQEVLKLRAKGIAAIITTGPTADSERYSSTFVANTPANSIVTGPQMIKNFGAGFSYKAVEQHLDYAGSHGPDVVVLMGEEVVVPGAGSPNAGKRIHRRFTDVFRKENGEWRYDLRHANVISIEGN